MSLIVLSLPFRQAHDDGTPYDMHTMRNTLHIYLLENVQHLNELLKDEMELVLAQPNTLALVGSTPKSHFLIQVPNNADKSTIMKWFRKTNLRYDTMAFSFASNSGILFV